MNRILALLLILTVSVQALRAEETPESAPATQKQRPKVGVVLSGGGAKGMAHIGALKTIEELGIPVDYIVGTSIGSIMAGIYALGYSADEMDSLVRAQNWDALMKDHIQRRNISYSNKKDDDRYLVTFPFMNHRSLQEQTQADVEKREKGVLRNLPSALVSGHNLDQLFTKLSVGYQDDIDFNTLPIPFACVAVDLNTKEEVVFHRGNIVTAIRASMSIPGYFAPVQVGDKFLIDGGMLNNLPVDVVKKMGADYVITVDLHHFKKDRPDTDQTIPEMVATMLSIMNGEKYQSGRNASDIIIEPNTSAYGVLSFDEKSVDALVDSGLVAAQRVLPQLRSLAQHLNEYPDSSPVRKKKAIDLSRDSVLISQMEIQGAEADDMAWLMSKTDLGPGKYVSGDDMDNAMSMFYNTKCFRKVNYAIAGKEDEGYRLKVNFVPQRLHQAGIGFRFDSEEMASILLGVSLNKYKLFGSKLDTKLELGANSNIDVSYGYKFHNLTSLNFTVSAMHTKFDIYQDIITLSNTQNYAIAYTERFKVLSAKADYQIPSLRSSDLKFGAKFEYYSYLFINATPDGYNMGEEVRSHNWQGFANWHFDNLDDSYFPRKGLQLNLFGAANYDKPYVIYEARLDMKAAIPLGSRATLIPQTYNRWMFGVPILYFENIVGGYTAGRYLPWQFPFVGINHTYTPTNKVDIVRADLRINLFAQHYLTLIGNYMAEWDFDAIDENKFFTGHVGVGATYSINTIIGPIKACVHWSNLSKKVGFHFSLGYDF